MRKIENSENIKPFFSIIIPVYNTEKYLRECLDSCINQNMNDKIQLVCVNDGSKDSSLEILNEYKNKYENIVVINQENGGVSKARNKAIENAKGKYCIFLDSDDIIYPDCLKKIYSIIKNKEYNAIICDYVKQWNVIKREKLQKIENAVMIKVLNDSKKIRALEKDECYGFACRYIFNIDYLKKNNVEFVEGMTMAEDRAFLIFALMNIDSIMHIKVPLFVYRGREDSAVHTYNENKSSYIDGKIKFSLYIIKYLKNNNSLKKVIREELKTEAYSNVRGSVMVSASLGNKNELNEVLNKLKENNLYPKIIKSKCKKPYYGISSLIYNFISIPLASEKYVYILCSFFKIMKNIRKRNQE